MGLMAGSNGRNAWKLFFTKNRNMGTMPSVLGARRCNTCIASWVATLRGILQCFYKKLDTIHAFDGGTRNDLVPSQRQGRQEQALQMDLRDCEYSPLIMGSRIAATSATKPFFASQTFDVLNTLEKIDAEMSPKQVYKISLTELGQDMVERYGFIPMGGLDLPGGFHALYEGHSTRIFFNELRLAIGDAIAIQTGAENVKMSREQLSLMLKMGKYYIHNAISKRLIVPLWTLNSFESLLRSQFGENFEGIYGVIEGYRIEHHRDEIFGPPYYAGYDPSAFDLGMVGDDMDESRILQNADDIPIWIERNGERLIDSIIDKNLDLRTKIGKQIKNALSQLMVRLESEKKYKLYNPNEEIVIDEKGREYVPFNDPDFQICLNQMQNEGKQFGGLLYMVEVMGSYYCGLTERNLEIRFQEHIIDALRGYVITEGDTNKPGYHKFYSAICTVLKLCYGDIETLHQELESYSILGQMNKRQSKLDEVYNNIEPFIKKSVIEIHYGTRMLSERESKLIERFPYKKLVEGDIIASPLYAINGPDYIPLRINGLNTAPGGAGLSISLPLYDIAIMLALGFSGAKIARTLQQEYNIFTLYEYEDFVKTIQHKIEDIFGGSYIAQEELLKPIIEHLDSIEGNSRHDIYLAFKDSELMNGWFSDWSFGKEYLKQDLVSLCEKFNIDPKSSWENIEPLIDIRERYYAGISESQWIDWITSSIPVSSLDRTYSYSREEESIMDNTRLGSRKVIEIIKTIANRYGYDTPTSFRYQLHKNLVLKVLKVKTITISEGEFININKDDFYEQICQYLFKPDRNRKPKTYFQNTLFPGLTVDQIWDIFAIPHKKLT